MKMERVDAFMHTEAIQFWRRLNLCVLKLLWSTWKRKCTKWMFLIIAQEKELILNGKFKNFQLLQFLLRYSKINLWVVKFLFPLNLF